MKYEYLLHTWGGFYNEGFRNIHKKESGFIYFKTENERINYVKELKQIEKNLNAEMLVIRLYEGYNVRTITTLHRVVKFKNKEVYTKCEMSPNYPYDVAKYHLENKWYPGFNDYPFGEDFDYEENEVETIQEWVTGSFDIKEG